MDIISISVITVVMACAVAGAIASLRDPDKGLGKEFLEGLHAIGHIFVPVAGIMASVPFLAAFVDAVFGKLYGVIGADPAMAATSVIAADMGGYRLAGELAQTTGGLVMALFTGYMLGATVVFSIPVGLTMLEPRDHKYMALGVLAGLLAIPVGVLVASLLASVLHPHVKTAQDTIEILSLTIPTILLNLAPLIVMVGLLALGLALLPDRMIRGFMTFGRGLDIAIKLVLAAVIVEYFTNIFYGKGVFTALFGGWRFDPIIADHAQIKAIAREKGIDNLPEAAVMRALEVAGYIGLMLSGAFPMVYLMKKHLAVPMEKVGKKLGLSPTGAAGILAAAANILAMFRLIRDMPPKDKVLCIAFAVCAAFTFGDHLAFTANTQPNLLMPVMLGKLTGGCFAFWLAYRLSVPKALELEKKEMEARVRAACIEVPVLCGKALVLKELGGGLTNVNYKVSAEGAHGVACVVRIFGENSELLGIDRIREVECQSAAAAAGVAPQVIASLPQHRALVTQFIDGKVLTSADAHRPEILRRIAQALRRCHDHPVEAPIGAFSALAVIRQYHQLASERGARLPTELPECLAILEGIANELKDGPAPCLCHNDLLAENFIDAGGTLTIIDWEYGGLGDPFFDLGNFAVNTGLTEDEERLLLTEYFGAARPEDLRRLHLMRLVSDMREAMWSFLQDTISTLHKDYHGRGREHLARFRAAAAGLQSPETRA